MGYVVMELRDTAAPEGTPEDGVTTKGTATGGVIEEGTWIGEAIADLRTLTHSFLIQEWHRYLDESFEKGIRASLDKGRVPKMKTRLNRADLSQVTWKPLTKVRETLARHLTEIFSRLSYEERIDCLGDLYRFAECNEEARKWVKTHVQIRDLFQHSNGVVRFRDLKDLGVHAISLTDDSGKRHDFRKGQKIVLSRADLEELLQSVDAHSLDLEQTK